jgi:hypothetical protein
MKTRRKKAEAYVNGDTPLPAGFTTGYQRDLEIAREMVKLRGDARAERRTGEGREDAADAREVA